MHRPNASLDGRTVLNLGSGRKPRADAINVDLVPGEHTDVVHDLDVLPWPFERDQFTEVLAYDVIEHLDRLVPVMRKSVETFVLQTPRKREREPMASAAR